MTDAEYRRKVDKPQRVTTFSLSKRFELHYGSTRVPDACC